MGVIAFTKMAITSLIFGYFHPDFAQLWWPFFATVRALVVASLYGHSELRVLWFAVYYLLGDI